MRIVVWNCKMGLSRKRQHLYDLHPDITVIPECSQTCLKLCVKDGFEGRWFGDNPRKGLGVLVAKPFHIARAQKPRSRWVVPLSIKNAMPESTPGSPSDFLLIAVWTMPVPGSRINSYIGQLHQAIVNNPQWFSRKPVIVTGDFNSNKLWDDTRLNKNRQPGHHQAGKRKIAKPQKPINHSTVVALLEKHRLTSAYHHFFRESQGEETHPTYYFYHHKNRPYHIDYIFLPHHWSSQIQSVEVGSHPSWHKLSDHVPLSVDVTLPVS